MRAVGLEGPDGEIAVRAAHADVWPVSEPPVLLVAQGRAAAVLHDCAGQGVTAFARAFRALEWPVQVVLWGGAVDGIPLSALYAALGPDRELVWDPARQVLHAYLIALADDARPDCADALRRVAAHIEHASLRDPRELHPHIAGCRSCQYAFPLRVAEELRLLASPDDPAPTQLVRQLASDRERLAAGLPLVLPSEAPRRRPPVALLAVAAGIVVVTGSVALASQSLTRHVPPAPPAPTAAAAGTVPASPPNGLPARAPAARTRPGAGGTATTATTAAPSGAQDGGASVAFGPSLADPLTAPSAGAPARAPGGRAPGGAAPAPAPQPGTGAHGSPAAPAAPAPTAHGATTTAPPAVSPDALPVPGSSPAPTTTAPAPVGYIPPYTPPAPAPTTAPATTAPPTTAPPTTAAPTTAAPTTAAPTTAAPTTAAPTTAAPTTAPPTTAAPTAAPPTTAAAATTTTSAGVAGPVVWPLAVLVPGVALPVGARRRARRRARRAHA